MEHERYIQSFDGTELFTRSIGSGYPIVLCDGIGCDGFIWVHLKKAFSQYYRFIHWHYRGHGLSQTPADIELLGMAALRQDLKAVLDAYQLDKAILIGHSMGVQLLLDFALHHPERTKALVPICGSYGRPLDHLHGNNRLGAIFPVLRDAILKWPQRTQWLWQKCLNSRLAYRFATTFEVNGSMININDFMPYFQHLSSMDATLFMRMLDDVRNHTVEDRLVDITTPSLIIAGQHDKFTPAWLSHRMQMLIAGAELLVVPNTTHVAPIEAPDAIHTRLEAFLKIHADNT